MRPLFAILCFWLLLNSPYAFATDYVWVIGGGPNPTESQAQIESNVNWVIQILKKYPGKRKLRVFFAAGRKPLKDVVAWHPPAESSTSLQPLARVFGDTMANGNHYSRQQVPDVVGSTDANELKKRLEREFSRLKPGDRALIIYNGHGSYNYSDDTSRNALRLWNNTHISARTMYRIMKRINPRVPVRFVFTQCFAGAFDRLVHPHAEARLALGKSDRCGFFAVSPYKESEGCSPSVKVGDYRDYTTYFFAALKGRTRTGAPLPVNPDLNHDGTVSLYEAHLYALSQAHSTDMPRSTSEMFLERWQPWYLRWVDTGAEPDNVYGRLAREVAKNNGLPQSGHALIRAISVRRRELVRRKDRLKLEKRSLKRVIRLLQGKIQGRLAMHWPEALSPYTLNFVHFLNTDLDAAQNFILADRDYPDLVAMQNRRFDINNDLLDINRDITQLNKIERLRQLARLKYEFDRHASAQDRAWYHRLLSCEELPL